MENNYITYIYMNCLKCSDCDCGMLVQDEVRLIKHDDCLGGVNVMFENNNITTNIIYDIEIDYRCINCDMRTFTKIKNHKGTIQHNLGV